MQREVWVHVIKREILSQQLNLGAKFHEQQSWQQNSHNIRNFASTGVLWFKIGHVVKNFLFKNLHWVKCKEKILQALDTVGPLLLQSKVSI